MLAEELMGLTVEELINDYGADFRAQEHWFGVTYSLSLNGTFLYDVPLGASPDNFHNDYE